MATTGTRPVPPPAPFYHWELGDSKQFATLTGALQPAEKGRDPFPALPRPAPASQTRFGLGLTVYAVGGFRGCVWFKLRVKTSTLV